MDYKIKKREYKCSRCGKTWPNRIDGIRQKKTQKVRRYYIIINNHPRISLLNICAKCNEEITIEIKKILNEKV